MKRNLIFFVATLLAFWARADTAWDAMQHGLDNYANGDFATAATNFDAAAMAAAQEKFDPAVASFDRANALLKSGKASDAAHAYEESLRTTDLDLQSKAYHNRGNAMLGIAGEQEKTEKFEDAIKSVDEAMTMYERSMMLATKDRDPKINYELSGRFKKQLEEKLKQQQQQNKDQNKDQKKDDKDQKDGKGQQDQKDKGKDDQKKNQQDKKDDKGDQQKQQEQQKQDQKGDEEKKQGQEKRAEQMSPQEAAMLLDGMKQREQAQREKMGQIWLKRSNAGRMEPVDKDW